MTDMTALFDNMAPTTLVALARTITEQLGRTTDNAERFALSRLQHEIFLAGDRNCGAEFDAMFRDAIAEQQES